jgi:hypothetical protein
VVDPSQAARPSAKTAITQRMYVSLFWTHHRRPDGRPQAQATAWPRVRDAGLAWNGCVTGPLGVVAPVLIDAIIAFAALARRGLAIAFSAGVIVVHVVERAAAHGKSGARGEDEFAH